MKSQVMNVRLVFIRLRLNRRLSLYFISTNLDDGTSCFLVEDAKAVLNKSFTICFKLIMGPFSFKNASTFYFHAFSFINLHLPKLPRIQIINCYEVICQKLCLLLNFSISHRFSTIRLSNNTEELSTTGNIKL